MTGELNQVSRSIGSLEASVKSISDQMTAHTELHAENHKLLSKKIDTLSRSVSKLCIKLEETEKDVNELKPVVNNLQAAKNQILGIISFGTLIVSTIFNLGIDFFKGTS